MPHDKPHPMLTGMRAVLAGRFLCLSGLAILVLCACSRPAPSGTEPPRPAGPPPCPEPKREISRDRDPGVRKALDELHAIHREGLPLRRELEKLSAALSGPFQSFGRKADDRALSVLRNAFGEVASSVFACAASRIAAGEAPAETKLRELDELARQAEATAGLAQGLRSDIALDIAMVKARVKLGRR